MNDSHRHPHPLTGRSRREDQTSRGRKSGFAALFAFLALAAVLIGIQRVNAAQVSLTEYQAKALFLLNFTKYVEWPASAFSEPTQPITIGIFGENKFGEDLQKAVAGKTIGGRTITIRLIDKKDDLGKCHILFVSASEKKRAAEILNQIKDTPVLTVGESDQFTDQGGIINFTMKEDNVRLEINLQAAHQARLQISSRLLGVADVVKGKR